MSYDSDEFSDVDIKGLRLEGAGGGGGGEGQADNQSEFDEDLDSFPYTYKKRWLILAVLSITIVINSFCLNLVGDFQANIQIFYRWLLPQQLYEDYLGEGFFFSLHVLVDVGFVLLAMLVLELRGLRSTCLVGITLSCLGAWIRCATVGNKLYAILFMGLVLCDVGQIYLTTALFYLSAFWFGKNETAVSIAIGLSANRLGVLMTIVFRMFFENNPDYRHFNHPYYGSLFVSIIATIALCLAIIFIRDDPLRPPSLAQCQIRLSNRDKPCKQDLESKLVRFGKSFAKVITSLKFIQLAVSFAILVGCLNSTYLLLKPILNEYKQVLESIIDQNERFVFEIASISVLISGIVGSISFAIILDQTKRFKLLLCLIYGLSIIPATGFVLTLGVNVWIAIVFLSLFGLFVWGYQPIGYEYAAELTYPHSIVISCGLLNIITLIITAIIRCLEKFSYSIQSSLYAHLFLGLLIIKGLFLTIFVPKDLRRQDVYINRQE